ncbi:MAG: hypothetical protein CVU56_07660 [Deltaproteobacteria bacterium HGW-Deltaproteobacteria-14]|jgi:hypothetical protein|nr:MAG: hypothetical protein CVU56_07660 [Deltaproteobacteria bacterium HGW-Deltaproteobacteria-14]
MRIPRVFPRLLALPLLLAACGGGDTDGRTCTVPADCASGVCLPSGQCAAPADTLGGGDASDVLFPDAAGDALTGEDAGPDSVADTGPLSDTATGDAAGPGDTTATDTAPDTATDTAGGLCHPNHDQVVSRSEAPFGPGFSANYRTTTDVTGSYDSALTCASDACAWDLRDVPGATADVIDETINPAGTWWGTEPAFADATFGAVLGQFNLSYFYWNICDQTQVGVYRVSDDALLLLGIVSEKESDGTELVYDPPLPILKFPLALGDSWTVDSTATGPLCGSFADYNIDWTATTTVDAAGTVRTPYGDFADTLRVNTVLERHLGIGVLPTSVRTHTFVAECFTSVAVVTSAEGADDESDGEIRDAAQVKRLANLP